MAAKQETLWFGYLEAGKKGSFVVRDVTLGTGTSATFYLFNLNRGAILEYRRDIAEPKLRELTEEEMEKIDELRQAFEQARKGFTPREARKPKPLPPTRKKARAEEVEEVDDADDDADDDTDDDDDDDDDMGDDENEDTKDKNDKDEDDD
jgi:hypothetical protein